jgi:hypothetical protein
VILRRHSEEKFMSTAQLIEDEKQARLKDDPRTPRTSGVSRGRKRAVTPVSGGGCPDSPDDRAEGPDGQGDRDGGPADDDEEELCAAAVRPALKRRKKCERAARARDVAGRAVAGKASALGADPGGRTVEELAGLIREAHQDCLKAAKEGLQRARDAGQLLIEMKKRCPHGEFRSRVRDLCGFGYSTAKGYMRVARRWAELEDLARSKGQPVALLTLRSALRLLVREDGLKRGGGLPAAGDAARMPPSEAVPGGSPPEPAQAQKDHADARRRGPSAGSTTPGAEPGGGGNGVRDRRLNPPPAGGKCSTSSPAPVDSTPKRTASEAEDEMSNEAWLATLPLHKNLNDPGAFDADALAWRKDREKVQALARDHGLTEEELRNAQSVRLAKGSWRAAVAFVAAVNHPRHWVMCDRLAKDQSRHPEGEKCGLCSGRGYLPTWVGEAGRGSTESTDSVLSPA